MAQKEALAEALRRPARRARGRARRPRPAARRSTASPSGWRRSRAPAENPFAEISEQLTRLYAQKDADGGDGVRPAGAAGGAARRARRRSTGATRRALDRFAERLEAVQGRVAALEAAENPFAEISEQLTRLYAQKDATVETVFARLAPLEAQARRARPAAAALDRFAERLEAVQGRVAALEAAENPFAEISEQLTRLYAQKDATVETVFARLAPLEARLAELATRDPGGARPLRRAAGGGAGPGGGARGRRRTRSRRSPSS